VKIVKRVLTYAAVGALIGGVGAGIVFGRGGAPDSSGNQSWAVIMVPTFALIGAIMGSLNALVVSIWVVLRDKRDI
jgi:sulfite exporter TauE/SafE